MYLKSIHLILLSILLFSSNLYAQEDKPFFDSPKASSMIGASASSIITVALSRADIVYAKTLIVPNIIKGDLGENIINSSILRQHLQESGNWFAVSPRFGRQGLDHLMIKYNKNGLPSGLLVGETKVNTSTLGFTQDGIQLGSKWVNNRLIELAHRFQSLESASAIAFKTPPLNPRHSIAIPLKNGQEVTFWRQNAKDSWKYDGPTGTLEEARKQAKLTAKYIEKAGLGEISYRKRLFNLKSENDHLLVTVKDAHNIVSKTSTQELPLLKEFKIRLNKLDSYANSRQLNNELAKQIQQKLPHLSDSDAKIYAKELQTEAQKYLANQKNVTLLPQIAYSMAIGGALSAGIDFISQIISGNEIDYGRVAFSGSVGAISVAIGNLTQIALIKYSIAQSIPKFIPNPIVHNTLLSSSVAGIASGLFFAYGGYFLGYMDITSANKLAFAYTTGGLAGVGAASLVTSLVGLYGTASTGVAISSLSGAAASSATYATIGGGTIATGGAGVAGGAMVLTAGAAAVAIAVGAAIMYGYSYFEAKDAKQCTQIVINNFLNPETMLKIVENKMR